MAEYRINDETAMHFAVYTAPSRYVGDDKVSYKAIREGAQREWARLKAANTAALDALESARGALRRIAGMECAMMYDSRTCRLDWSPDDSTNWCGPCIARAELDKEQG